MNSFVIPSFLSMQGFRQGRDDLLWKIDDANELAYSDGTETEERIYQIISGSEDLSPFSDELHYRRYDWPSYYHLHRSRACIIRPFIDEIKNKRVLEVGSGCGAITSFLGSYCSEVLAVEGSYKRAQITRSRTRNMSNVHVLVSDIGCLHGSSRLFDVVIMVGVLEYASKYNSGLDAHEQMLKHVHSFVRSDGMLLIAIENQLGLKYYAGVSEDHMGIPWFGVENRYCEGQPKTYGKAVLDKAIRDSGFHNIAFAGAYPDYKFTQFLLFERGHDTDMFNAFPLIANAACSDPQLGLASSRCFSLYSSWRPIIANGMGISLANSLLVICSPDGELPHRITNDTYGIYFSTNSPSSYCKQLCFLADDSGKIQVERSPLKVTEQDASPEVTTYVNSRSIEEMFLDDLDMSHRVTIGEAIGRLSQTYSTALKVIANLNEFVIDLEISGRHIDLIPRNILVSGDESGTQSTAIDQEWQMPYPISLGFLFYRGIYNSLLKAAAFQLVQVAKTDLNTLIYPVIQRAFPVIPADRLAEYCDQEAFLMSLVRAGAFEKI
jgi:SAM-dependent methyltransferase